MVTRHQIVSFDDRIWCDLTLDSLSTVEFSMDTKGKLSLNSTKFNTAVLDYQDDVEVLFSNQLDSGSEPVSFSNVLMQKLPHIRCH